MAFYREIQGVLLIDGAWVAADIRQTSPIQITQGGMDEQRKPTPSKCTLTLNNLERVYSPKNPASINYQKLGVNTPLLIRVLLARDEFAGTTVAGWGSAEACGIRDTAYAWTTAGTAADFNEASGAATMLISAAATAIYAYLPDVSYKDYGVLVEASCSVTNVTGGSIELGSILLRGGATFYIVQVSISTAEVLTVGIIDFTGATVAAPVVVSGVVDAVSAKTISVRAECEGEILRARVWKTGEAEPGTWDVATESRTYLSAGWPGIRSATGVGNTNVPVTFSYGRVEVYSMEFAGEVAKWPPERSDDGIDRYVPIVAWDLFQRLKQGKSPLKSALRRGITSTSTNVVAYWPCEDGRNATVVGSDSAAGPMIVQGPSLPDFATSDDFPCSADLLVVNGCNLNGTVPPYTPTSGQSQVRLLVSIPAAGATNGTTLLRARMTGGTAEIWDVVYGTGGTLTLNIYDPVGTLLHTTGAVVFTLNGRPLRLSLEFTQDGADIDWNLSVIDLNGSAGGISGTLAGRTYNRVSFVGIGGDATFTNVVVGHITVENIVNGVGALLAELLAYTGERAQARILRQATADGITAYVGQGSVGGIEMGPQRPLRLLEVFEECTAADLGGLATCQGEVAMRYDRLNYSYNRAVDVSLDLAGHQAEAAKPEFDNFLLRNVIRAPRIDGSEYTATQLTGRLAAVDVMDGGVGVYDEDAGTGDGVNVRYDSQLPDVAHYLLVRGTIDQPRFPELTIDLASPAVRADEVLTRQLLDLDLWQRLQVENADAEDLYDTVDQFTVGITKTLSRFIHRLEINSYPYDSHRIFELDSETYGRLDSDTTTLNEALDSSETGVDVAVSDGALWSTSTPTAYDVAVGGERITVSAVAGASSPQTFTVTRNVNGVPVGGLTHSVGDEVRLADPVYLAGW
jgi:hypothetical protein